MHRVQILHIIEVHLAGFEIILLLIIEIALEGLLVIRHQMHPEDAFSVEIRITVDVLLQLLEKFQTLF